MKTIITKSSVSLLITLAAFTAGAQTGTKPQTASNYEIRMMRDVTHTENGKRVEQVETEINDKFYRINFVDDKLEALSVEGEKIPATDWGKYSDVVSTIRQELKEQAKRNAEQQARNREQEKRNAEQAVRNEEQAKRNAEQAVRNQEQEKLNVEQALRNAEQVKRNEEQEVRNKEQEKLNAEQVLRDEEQKKRDREQAVRNEQQAKTNAEQAVRNEEQEKRNAEQTVRNKEQAKRNAEQASAMDALMKDLKADLVNDKIIKDGNDLEEFRINDFGMSVNGIRQPEDVFKRYREKYSKEKYGSMRDFNYSRDGIISGQ
ncbi:MAG TPA: hypothetical protein VHE59_10365 [Mucilaginibacter sp.]|nr:hypothetical protein [Mucilaginibacter sp.]